MLARLYVCVYFLWHSKRIEHLNIQWCFLLAYVCICAYTDNDPVHIKTLIGPGKPEIMNDT